MIEAIVDDGPRARDRRARCRRRRRESARPCADRARTPSPVFVAPMRARSSIEIRPALHARTSSSPAGSARARRGCPERAAQMLSCWSPLLLRRARAPARAVIRAQARHAAVGIARHSRSQSRRARSGGFTLPQQPIFASMSPVCVRWCGVDLRPHRPAVAARRRDEVGGLGRREMRHVERRARELGELDGQVHARRTPPRSAAPRSRRRDRAGRPPAAPPRARR